VEEMGKMISKLVFIPPPWQRIRATHSLTHLQTAHYTIPVLYVPGRKQPPDNVIIFSHGNAEDLGCVEGWLTELSLILDADIVGYDYPGYGLSKGKDDSLISPSEKGVYEAADAVYDYITTKRDPPIPPNKIILFGRSLGTGPTVDLASRQPQIKGVILQSPLLSAVRVVMRTLFTLPIDVFANVDKIHKVKAPVLIIHGEADEVISVTHGKTLSGMIKNSYPPFFIPRAGHNDIEISFFHPFTDKLKEFIAFLNRPNGNSNESSRSNM